MSVAIFCSIDTPACGLRNYQLLPVGVRRALLRSVAALLHLSMLLWQLA